MNAEPTVNGPLAIWASEVGLHRDLAKPTELTTFASHVKPIFTARSLRAEESS
jgi:hypothetical protein